MGGVAAVRDAADIVASQMTEAEHLEQVKAVALTCGWRLYHTFVGWPGRTSHILWRCFGEAP